MIKPGQTQCQADILAGIAANNISALPLLTEILFTINAGETKLFWFDVVKITEIQKFLLESNATVVNLVVNIFKSNPPTVTMVGSFSVTNFTQQSQQDTTSGRYYICIYNLGNSANIVRLTRTNTTFPNVAKMQIYSGAGTRLNISLEGLSKFNVYQLDSGTIASATLTKTNPAVPAMSCGLPINYYLIEGILPDGITLAINGLLSGIIDCIDCNKVIENFVPSSSWYGQAATGEIYSWGRQWRFKARIELGNYSNIFSEQWFCIRVYKNWSIDHEKLQAMDLNDKDIVIELKEDTIINQFCIPCTDDTIVESIITASFNPNDTIINTVQDNTINSIETEFCSPCSNNIITITDTILLRPNLNINQSNLLEWYISNSDKRNSARLFRRQLEESEVFNYLLIKNNIIEGIAPTSSISISLTETDLVLSMSIFRNDTDLDKQILDIVTTNNVYLSFEGHVLTGEAMII